MRELTAKELLLVSGGSNTDPIAHDPGPHPDDGSAHDPSDVHPPESWTM
jgi:hypothetical protein